MYFAFKNTKYKYILCIVKIIKTLYGGIAQLGECLTGSQKVTGSSPVISTKGKFVLKTDNCRTFL